MTAFIGVLVVLLAAAPDGGPYKRDKQRETGRMASGPTLHMVEDSGEEGLHNDLNLSVDGQIDYRSQSNSMSRDRVEIGQYHTTADAGELSDLWALLASPTFAAMEDHFGKLTVGDVARRLLYTNAGARVEKLIAPSLPSPNGFRRIDAELRRIVEIAKTTPVRVMHVEVSWPSSPVQRGSRGRLTVTLSNIGSRPIEYANPLRRDAIDEPALVVRAERSDVALLALRPHHVVTQAVGQADLRVARPALDPRKPTTTLPPGGDQVLELSVPFDWPPGKYNIAVIWSDPGRSGGENFLSGELYSASAKLEIGGPSRPGDEGAPPPADDVE